MHPISYFQAIVLGLLQGVSELFPISSLGHAVVLPRVFGWNIHQNDKFFITFLVAVHLATALVLLGFFWHDWVRIVKGSAARCATARSARPDAKLGWLLVVGTIPAGILGLLLEQPLRKLFASAHHGRDLHVHQRAAAVRRRAPAPPRARRAGARARRGQADRPPRLLAPGGRRRRRPGAGADPRHLALRA